MKTSAALKERLTADIPTYRLKILLLGFMIIQVLIVLRLFSLQVLQNQSLTILAKSQQQITETVAGRRGGIYSADNFPLSSSRQSWLLWGAVPQIEDVGQTAKALAQILTSWPEDLVIDSVGGDLQSNFEATGAAKTREDLVRDEEERLVRQLQKDVVWVALKNKVTRVQKEEIEALGLTGLGFDEQEDRDYPEASLAAHLLGFVGRDAAGEDKGYFGLEGYYDLTLKGVKGEKAWERDASGKPIILGSSQTIAAVDGIDLKTNINRSIQFLLEKHLRDGVEKYQAARATAVVARPDGAILAIASIPAFEPSRYSRYPSARFVDPAIGESFEPGSIFKVLIMAAALDAGVVEPDTRCENCSGPRQIAEYTIGSGSNKYYPETTMSGVIEHSDNVGMIWVAERLGKEALYDYLKRFGIGSLSGIDLQGEVAPSLRKLDDWTVVDLATASFGQGVAVTPLQMVRSLSAIANSGRLPRPFVVKKVEGADWQKEIKPEYSEQVLDKKAAQQITEMMVRAVDSRADVWGKPEGFRIAGKTGTAQIPVAGHYDADKTIHSFMGFAPAENAQFVIIVSLKDPQGAEYASQTAAPLWFSIVRDIIPILGIQPD